jgi:hypothetical protein
LTLLIIAAGLSAALYNCFLKGPILIGAALVSNVSISIIFELGHRLGDDHHYSLWLWPVVAVAYLWARLSQPDRPSRNNLGFRVVLSGTTFRSQAAAFAA